MSADHSTSSDWPSIPYADWQTTAAALHLYLQIVGKYRLARTPAIFTRIARGRWLSSRRVNVARSLQSPLLTPFNASTGCEVTSQVLE